MIGGVGEGLVQEQASVLDIAFDSGFGDISNFNRGFHTEFGMSPRAFRVGECGRNGHIMRGGRGGAANGGSTRIPGRW